MTQEIDENLLNESFYIGVAEIDVGDLIHESIFNLIPVFYMKQNVMYYNLDNNIIDWNLKFKYSTVEPLAPIEFRNNFRPVSFTKPLSDQGKGTGDFLNSNMKFYHHKKVAHAFLKLINSEEIKDYKFDTSQAYEHKINIPKDKLVKYALDIEHDSGGSKAKFFRDTLDIEASNWMYLDE